MQLIKRDEHLLNGKEVTTMFTKYVGPLVCTMEEIHRIELGRQINPYLLSSCSVRAPSALGKNVAQFCVRSGVERRTESNSIQAESKKIRIVSLEDGPICY